MSLPHQRLFAKVRAWRQRILTSPLRGMASGEVGHISQRIKNPDFSRFNLKLGISGTRIFIKFKILPEFQVNSK